MQLKYGSTSFDANTALVATATTAVVNDGGQIVAHHRKVDVEGYLAAASQAALSSAELSLRAALARPNQDLILYLDSGAESAVSLKSRESIDGVKITSVLFPTTKGPEYATERWFKFTAESEVPVAGSAAALLSYRETIENWGGGPLYAHLPAVNGPAQKQLLYQALPYSARQSGESVGYRGYPAVPPPVWPAALMKAPRITRVGPRRRGNGYESFAVEWEYEFEAIAPLVGLPSLWVN